MRILFAIILLAVLPPLPRISPSAQSPMPRISTPPAPEVIDVFGDSISADCTLTPPGSYCAALGAMLDQAGVSHVFIGRAVSGADCGYTASNVDAWLAADAPTLVLLECGTNNLPIDAASQALMGQQWRTIVEHVHAYGARLAVSFIGYSNPVNISLAGTGLPIAEADANDVIDANLSLYPADWFAGLADFQRMPGDLDYLKADGIHPRALGHQRMAAIWYRSLEAAMGWPDIVSEPCGMWGYRPGGTPPAFTPCSATS